MTAVAPHELARRLRGGDRLALSRALSVVEQGHAGAGALLAELAPHRGGAQVIGVTGPPGAGKSTLVHGLLGEWLAQGRQVAVLAVDPSSPLSGGALLGDRVRMGTHGAHPGVFIRSVASRGRQGALSPTTAGLVDVLDAAGFPLIVVETVGAGQAEVDILSLADTRIVACPPGLGDEVQALKAGILEIADVLAVTKADLPQAALTVRELRDMLQLRRPAGSGGWVVPVVATSARQGTGVDELAAAAEAHRAWAGQGHRLAGTAAAGATATAQRQASPGHPIAATDSEEGRRIGRLMAADPWVRRSGIRCLQAGPGWVELALELTAEHLNFNGSCHGGVVFTLADTAFGLAANSRGAVAAGIDAHITFQRPARAGDRLLARAEEVSRTRRLAVVRVDVRLADGRPLSTFTGTVFIAEQRHD
jgi:LAO/AO transport system kinase